MDAAGKRIEPVRFTINLEPSLHARMRRAAGEANLSDWTADIIERALGLTGEKEKKPNVGQGR